MVTGTAGKGMQEVVMARARLSFAKGHEAGRNRALGRLEGEYYGRGNFRGDYDWGWETGSRPAEPFNF